MLVSLKISDEVYEKYAEYDNSNPRLAMEQQLNRFKDISPKDRDLIIPSKARQALEALLGRQIETPEDLVKVVDVMVKIKVGNVEIPLTEGQMKRLLSQAAFWHQPIEKFTTDKVKAGIVQ